MTPQTIPSDAWSESVIALLERQQAVVSELADLSARQGALIEKQETDELLSLLARRQELIDRFSRSQQELGSLTGDLDQRLEQPAPSRRKRIGELIERLSTQLNTVLEQDEFDQSALQRGRDHVRSEIDSLTTGRQAQRAYQTAGRANRFTNEQG